METKGILDALHTWKPEVVLDVHESAVLKKKSLGSQGHLTDFEAQFESANNPNVDGQIRAFSFNHLLPALFSLRTGSIHDQAIIRHREISAHVWQSSIFAYGHF